MGEQARWRPERPPVAAALLVEAARRAPEDDALAYEAEGAVEASGDEALKRSLDDALPVARRLEALLHLADKHEREGQRAEATVALERALAGGQLVGETRNEVVTRLRRLYAAERRSADLEDARPVRARAHRSRRMPSASG